MTSATSSRTFYSDDDSIPVTDAAVDTYNVSQARPDEDDVRFGVLAAIETAHAEFYRYH